MVNTPMSASDGQDVSLGPLISEMENSLKHLTRLLRTATEVAPQLIEIEKAGARAIDAIEDIENTLKPSLSTSTGLAMKRAWLEADDELQNFLFVLPSVSPRALMEAILKYRLFIETELVRE